MAVRALPRDAGAALSLAVVSLVLAVPATATAAVPIADFSVTPSTARAGAHSALAVRVAFGAAPSNDDVRDVSVRLAPGLIADPGAADRCPRADFAADRCSARARVGSVSLRAATLLGSLDAAGDVYNLAPSEDELARLGVWLRPLGQFAKQRIVLPVRLRPGGGHAVEVTARDLPRTVAAIAGVSEVPIRVEQLTLALEESIGGRPFVRNPTSCAAAVSRVTARSWQEPETASSQVSSFTPAECSAQPFGARLRLSIGRGGDTAAGRLAALEASMQLAPGQAALRQLQLSLPPDLAPNLAAATRACLPEALAAGTCPPQSRIGSARASSPLLSAPLDGAVLLGLEPTGLPRLAIALRGPPAIMLEGSIRVVKRRINVLFDALPDLPLTEFRLRIAGLLRAHRDLCRRRAVAVPAVLTAHNGRSLRFRTKPLAAACARARARRG